jgi:hypothetical protein
VNLKLAQAGIAHGKFSRAAMVVTIHDCAADPTTVVTVAAIEALVQAEEAAWAAAETARLAEVAEIESFVAGDGFTEAKVSQVKAALASVLTDIATAKANAAAAGNLAQLKVAVGQLADAEDKLAKHLASVVKQLARRRVFWPEVQG